jgi:hypothetical protein
MIKNPLTEALKESGNVIGLASAVALSVALLNPIPLLVGIVAETAYLMFVPGSNWYTARLSKRYDGEIAMRHQQLKAKVLPTLRLSLQNQYGELESIRAQLEKQDAANQDWFRELLRKLDYLMDKFLQFSEKEQEFLNYLLILRRQPGQVPQWSGKHGPSSGQLPQSLTDQDAQRAIAEIQAAYDAKREELKQAISAAQDDASKEINQKRADIISQRKDYVTQMGKTLANLALQLQLIVDSFGLVNDQIRVRTPEQVTADVDDVISQTDLMTKTLSEILPLEDSSA